MNISNLFNHKKTIFSLEIFPPKKDTSYNTIYNTLLKLRGIPADFISVTYGAGGSQAQREKTIEIASLILATYHTEPVAHLTCVNLDRQEAQDTLEKLKANQVQNIMVLRGDISPDVPPRKTSGTPATWRPSSSSTTRASICWGPATPSVTTNANHWKRTLRT